MNKKKSIILVITAVVLLSGLFFLNNSINKNSENITKIQTKYVSLSSVIDSSDINKIVGFYDYVFVGEVTEHIGNFEPLKDSEEMQIPYNKFKVKVLENIKGELVEETEIKKIGGYMTEEDGKTSLILLDKQDYLPQVGETYVFIGSGQEDGGILIECSYGQKLLSEQNEKQVNEFKKAKDNEVIYERRRYKSKYEIKK